MPHPPAPPAPACAQGMGTSRSTVAKIRDAIMEERATSKLLLNYRKDGTPW